jgi:uncharacterized protein (UPF0335 family)
MISNSQIVSVVERIERMEDEKSAISLDISELYKEAKGNGFDVKILRKVVAARKKPQNQRDSENAIFELYMSAVGFEQTPLGKYSEGTE